MSINQDVYNELGELGNGNLEDIGKVSNPSNILPTPGTFSSPDSRLNEGTETPLTDQVRAKLLDPQTKFVEIRDGVEEVSSMEDMLDQIVENTTISAADAGLISPRFEGFSNHFHPASFTKQPTKVNYTKTCEYMANSLKLRKEGVISKLQYFFSESVSDAEESFNLYKSFYSAELIESLSGFQAQVAEWKKGANHIGDQCIFLDGEEYNAATGNSSIASLTDAKLGQAFNQVNFDKFKNVVQDFENQKKTNLLAGAVIRAVNDNRSIDDFIDAKNRVASYGMPITCLDLVNAFSSPYLVTLLLGFEKLAKGAIDELIALEKEYKPDPNDFKSVRDFVVNNGEIFDKASQYCHYYAESIDTIRRLYLVASGVLEYFVSEK